MSPKFYKKINIRGNILGHTQIKVSFDLAQYLLASDSSLMAENKTKMKQVKIMNTVRSNIIPIQCDLF